MRNTSTEIQRLCATISPEQRAWCGQYTFEGWPEYLIEHGVLQLDKPPTVWEWWELFRAVFEDATGREAPDMDQVARN